MENKQKMRLTESSIPKGKSEVKQRNDTQNGKEGGGEWIGNAKQAQVYWQSAVSLGSYLLFVP